VGNGDPLQLLALQEEADRLRELIDALAGDPLIEPLRQLVQEAERVLQEAEQIAAAAGVLGGPLPWWEDWQRRHVSGSATASVREPLLLETKRQLRVEQARLARQRALLTRLSTQDHLLPAPKDLRHALMRAQLLIKARLLMLQHFKK
jgi:hypothetical protein